MLVVLGNMLVAQEARQAEELSAQALQLSEQGRYAEAIPFANKALEIRERTLGPEHPETVVSLARLAGLYIDQGAYSKAEPLLQRALSAREKVSGGDDPGIAAILTNLAAVFSGEGDYAKAEALGKRALMINENVVGPEDPITARSLNNLAGLYEREGIYPKAEELLRRALTICEKALGAEHRETAGIMNNLAVVYYDRGAYNKAEPMYQRALAIREKVLGPDHPETAETLNNYAGLYAKEGAYSKAEPMFQRALAIREKVLGPDHPDTALSLSTLAGLYAEEGAYSKAEPMYQRALAIREKVLGPDHPDIGSTLNGLAVLYGAQGASRKAKLLYQRALAIFEKALGPDHPNVADILGNLADIYRTELAFGEAEPMYQRALSINEKALGPDHPIIAHTLTALSSLYLHQGAYTKAEPLCQRALAIVEKTLGPENPETALSLNDLAVLYIYEGAYTKAEPLSTRALATLQKALGPLDPDVSAVKRDLAIVHALNGDWTRAAAEFEFLIRNKRDRDDLAFGRDFQKHRVANDRELLIAVLRDGALLPGQRRSYLPLFLETVLTTKARISDEMLAALEALKSSTGQNERALIEQFEMASRAIGVLSERGPAPQPSTEYWQQLEDLEAKENDLAAKIASRSADFRKLSEEPSPERVARSLRNQVLVEIVRTAQFRPAQAVVFGDPLYCAVVLFPDGGIEMTDLGPAKPIDDLIAAYRQAQDVIDNREQAEILADRLGSLIIAPISNISGGNTEWFVAADGEIRLLPLSGLRLDGRFVAERYRIWSIGSGRDLLAFELGGESRGNDLIIANPAFGDGTAFSSLPETEEEAELIGELLPDAEIVEPAKRTKSFLLGLGTAPRILHLATHAFYRTGDGDPTLRSGIALNGANQGADGILTAKEAQTLRLRGTQLVVMSACETGIGEVSFEDGIVGMQRSLLLAGARTQMLTEWPVDLGGTRDFMVRFYRKLAAGRTKGQAWLETQRQMIGEGVAPHYWAPFVLYGDPGPLKGQ